MAMVGSLFAIAILAFLVWAHHMFVTGLNPFLGSVFVLLTLLIAVPSAIKVFNWLTTFWRGNVRFTPGMLFAIGFVSLFISGGLTGIFLGNSALDLHLHATTGLTTTASQSCAARGPPRTREHDVPLRLPAKAHRQGRGREARLRAGHVHR